MLNILFEYRKTIKSYLWKKGDTVLIIVAAKPPRCVRIARDIQASTHSSFPPASPRSRHLRVPTAVPKSERTPHRNVGHENCAKP